MKHIWPAAAATVMAVVVYPALVVSGAPRFGVWSAPVNLEAAFPYAHENLNTPGAIEGCPAISGDGKTLYFASNRNGTLDIWRSTREAVEGEWGAPEPLPDTVNRPDSNEFCPTPLRNGRDLLFVSNKAGCGGGDIYITREHPGRLDRTGAASVWWREQQP